MAFSTCLGLKRGIKRRSDVLFAALAVASQSTFYIEYFQDFAMRICIIYIIDDI